MISAEPTLEEWRRLYEAAAALREAQSWRWMEETDLFGVQNPETGLIGYTSIMGSFGQHLSLALYMGTEGLAGFWRLEEDELAPPEHVLEVPHCQAFWEQREALASEDREVIKQLGLKFRGRQAWPLFRSFTPGYVPWFLTGEEARFLTLALEQGLEVSRRVREEPDLLDNPDDQHTYLVRVPKEQDGAQVWMDEWFKPLPLAVQPLAPALDEADLAPWRRARRLGMTLEVDLCLIPVGIKEGGDARPCYAYALLVVDADSGYVFGTDILAPRPSLDAVWVQTPAAFLKSLRQLDGLPRHLHLRDTRVREVLEPLAAELSMRVVMRRTLPALDEAKASLVDWMR